MARPKSDCDKKLIGEITPDWLWICLRAILDTPLEVPNNLNDAQRSIIARFYSDWNKIAFWITALENPEISTGSKPYNNPHYMFAKYEAQIVYHWLTISKALFDISPKYFESNYKSYEDLWVKITIEHRQQQINALLSTHSISLNQINDAGEGILSILKMYSSVKEIKLEKKKKTQLMNMPAKRMRFNPETKKFLLNNNVLLKVKDWLKILPPNQSIFYEKAYEIFNTDFSKEFEQDQKAKEFKNNIWQRYLEIREECLNYYLRDSATIPKAIFENEDALYYLEPTVRGRPKKIFVKK